MKHLSLQALAALVYLAACGTPAVPDADAAAGADVSAQDLVATDAPDSRDADTSGTDAQQPQDAVDATTEVAGTDAVDAVDAGSDAADTESTTDASPDVEDVDTAATDSVAGTDVAEPEVAPADMDGIDVAIDAGPDDTGVGDADAEPDEVTIADVSVDAGFDDASLPDAAPADVADDVDAGADDTGGTPCTWFAPCTPSNACHVGHWICPPGGETCSDLSANVADGTACGVGGACLNGACQVCGGACTPLVAPCHVGIVECADGNATCQDTSVNAPDLTACWGSMLCTGGTCAPCVAYAPCMPADPCHTGYLTCGATPECVDTKQPGTDGVTCGSDQVCNAGSCAVGPYTLSFIAGGGQNAFVDDDLPNPVALVLKDAANQPLVGAVVQVQAPEGALVKPDSDKTDGGGQVVFALRLNLKVDAAVTFTATGPGDAVLPLTFAATAPPEGTIFAALNRDGPSTDPPTKVATKATSNLTRGLAFAKDGTLYYTEAGNGGFGDCYVKTISPLGEVNVLGGSALCAFGGDDGPVADAEMNVVSDLALDEAGQTLYLAETGSNRVRQVNLQTGIITTFAGGGTASSDPWGDDGPATDAKLQAPTRIGWGPAPAPATGNVLYISDDGHGRLRWVDAGGTIHTLLAPQAGDCGKDPLLFAGCNEGCDTVFDANGALFFTGWACGTDVGTPENGLWANAIFRRDPDGTLTRIAGQYAYDTLPDGPAITSFIAADTLAIDPGGNLFFSGYNVQQIRRIDGRSGLLSTVAGQIGSYGNAGDYVPGSQASFTQPHGLAVSPDLNLWVTDSQQLRVLWGVAHAQPSDVLLSDSSSGLKPFFLDAPFVGARAHIQAGPLMVPSVPVAWSAVDAGAGVRKSVYLTDPNGDSTPEGRVGLQAKTYTLRAQANDIHGTPLPGSPLDLEVSAKDVVADTIFPIFAVDPVGLLEGAATLAKSVATDVAASKNGTLYIAGTCGIFAVQLPGAAKLIAGNGVDCAFSNPTGTAIDARLSPGVLALDDANDLLYAADAFAGRVVVVNLSTGGLSTFAGGGSSTNSPWGDGGQATDATLQEPIALTLGNGGLYIADSSRNQIRFVNANGVISTLPISQADCTWGTGCTPSNPGMCWPRDLAWDSANGQLLVSAAACGPVAGDASAVLSIKPGDSQATWFAGASLGTGNSADGVDALSAEFGMYAGGLTIGFDGNDVLHLLVAYSYDKRLRKISAGKVYTVAGVQNPQPGGPNGDYGPLPFAQFGSPSNFAFIPAGGLGKIAIVDNGIVRLVW